MVNRSPRTAPTACPTRYDLDEPGNQQKLEAADALGKLADDAGMPLVHLAVAWVLRNPAVTSAIIGPRTMEQLTTQLGAADVDLDDDVLDRIDEIVPPGHQLHLGRRRLPAADDRRLREHGGAPGERAAGREAGGGVGARPRRSGASPVRDRTTVAREDQRNAYVLEARAIEARHAAQTVDDVEALRRKYQAPVFGTVRVWDLVERLAQCVDPSDCALFWQPADPHPPDARSDGA